MKKDGRSSTGDGRASVLSFSEEKILETRKSAAENSAALFSAVCADGQTQLVEVTGFEPAASTSRT